MSAMKRGQLHEIQGVRVLLSVSVVALHTSTILMYYLSAAYGDKDLLDFKNAPWQGIVRGLACQVDVFMAISGYLTAKSLLSDVSMAETSSLIDTIIKVVYFMAKKVIRLWPCALVSVLLAYIMNDINVSPLSSLLYKILTFEMDEASTPMSLVVIWSNKVEIIATLLLSSILLIPSTRKLVTSSKYWVIFSLLIIVLTIIPPTLTFINYSTLSLSLMQNSDSNIPLYMSTQRVAWLQDAYNMTNAPINSIYPIIEKITNFQGVEQYDDKRLVRLLYAKLLYLAPSARITPFFIGCFSYVAVTKSTSATASSFYNKLMHVVLVIASSTILLLPALLGLKNYRLYQQGSVASGHAAARGVVDAVSGHDAARGVGDYILLVMLRPLYAAAASYFLYRIYSKNDVFAESIIDTARKALSIPLFQALGKVTYCVYIIHFRFLLDIVMWYITPDHLSALSGIKNIGFFHLCFYTALTYMVCGCIAYFIHRFVEIPSIKLGTLLLDNFILQISKKRKIE
jgi:peptidoglycan/LPS O-acetylase OafA/YrhL